MSTVLYYKAEAFAKELFKSKPFYRQLSENMVKEFCKLPDEYIKALTPYVIFKYAFTQYVLDKLPNFIINNKLGVEAICKAFGISVTDLLIDEAISLLDKDILLQECYVGYSDKKMGQEEVLNRYAASERSLSEKGLSPEMMELFKDVLNNNIPIATYLNRTHDLIKEYSLTPTEFFALSRLHLSEKDFLVVKTLNAEEVKKVGLLYEHHLSIYIKTVDDLKASLQLTDYKLLNKYPILAKLHDGAPDVLIIYGVSKVLDALSKYNWDEMKQLKFFKQIIKEGGKYAEYGNDLDILAKIILNPGLNDYWKTKFIECRHSPEEWKYFETELKDWENSWSTYLDKMITGKPYANLEEYWPEINCELVNNNLITTEA